MAAGLDCRSLPPRMRSPGWQSRPTPRDFRRGWVPRAWIASASTRPRAAGRRTSSGPSDSVVASTQAIAASSDRCSDTSCFLYPLLSLLVSRALAIVPSRRGVPKHPTRRPPVAAALPRMIGGLFCRPRLQAGSHAPTREDAPQFDERHVRCLSDMPERTGEFVRTPHVENERGVIPLKPHRERRWFNPRRGRRRVAKPAGQ